MDGWMDGWMGIASDATCTVDNCILKIDVLSLDVHTPHKQCRAESTVYTDQCAWHS